METCDDPLMEDFVFRMEQQKFSDPVQRDVITGDWEHGGHKKKVKIRYAVILFLVAALLMMGAYLVMTHAAQPQSSEKNAFELPEITDDNPYSIYITGESRVQYEKMQKEIKKYIQKREENRARMRYIIIFCALSALFPLLYVIVQYLCGRLSLTSTRDFLSVIAICLGCGVLLFINRLAYSYIMFIADRNERMLAFTIIMIAAAIALWYFARRAKSKQDN